MVSLHTKIQTNNNSLRNTHISVQSNRKPLRVFTQANIVLERYFRFEISLLSILCMLIARMEVGTSRVSGDSDIIT